MISESMGPAGFWSRTAGATISCLGFEWLSFGPMSWFASISLVDTGDGQPYVTVESETAHRRVVARIFPVVTREIFSDFLRDFFSRNGTAYGIDGLFGSLPTTTESYSPDLVTLPDVKTAYWAFMTETQDDGWMLLKQEVAGRTHEPDHLMRCLKLLEEPPPQEDWVEYLELQRYANCSLSETQKRAILAMYMTVSWQDST